MMKKSIFFILFACALTILPIKTAHAFLFHQITGGARAQGMGGAFVSIADDSTAAYWNVAGLTQLQKPELTFTGMSWYVQLYERGTDTYLIPAFLAYANPIGSQTMAFSFMPLLGVRGTVHRDNDPNQPAVYSLTSNVYYIGVSLAREITKAFSAGFTLKFVQAQGEKKFTKDWTPSITPSVSPTTSPTGTPTPQPTIPPDEKHKGQGIGWDFGLLWKPTDEFSMGASLMGAFDLTWTTNVSQPVERPGWNHTGTDRAPWNLRFGMSYRHKNLTLAIDNVITTWNMFDPKGVNDADGWAHTTTQVRVGAEYLFFLGKRSYPLPLRLGILSHPHPWDSDKDSGFITAGTGLIGSFYQVDLCFERNILLAPKSDRLFTLSLSIALRF